jgi:hypothetical protein
MNSPAETITPSVHTAGFTLVEEDDVAFSLSLCKEIHRIYGSYQSGDLEATDSVHLGLSLTAQVLATLGGAVTKGMPAMRIEVAAAQAREMMAVMFDEPVSRKATRVTRQAMDRRCSRPVGTPMAVETPKLIAAKELPGSPQQQNNSQNDSAISSAATRLPLPTPSPLAEDRLRSWFADRSLPVRIALGIVGCVIAAVLTDIPIALLLLYSNMFLQLVLAYAFLGLWGRSAYRRRSAKLRTRE